MIIDNIESLNLHDSELTSIFVRITDEGDKNISLCLDYMVDYQSFKTVPKILIFKKCWSGNLKMNFRVQGSDAISSAKEMNDSHLIGELRDKWANVNVAPPSGLRHFVLTTSLSGSQLDVIAEELYLIDAKPG